MPRLGLLGGTFDPVHFGHLRPAVEIKAALGLDELALIPCRVSPHRDMPAASAGQRLAMLEAATAGMSDLSIDARELDREGPSYTIDTLMEIAAERPDTRLYLIIGADACAAFERWHRWSEILELANLVVSQRPGWPLTIPDGLAPCRVERAADLHRRAVGGLLVQSVTQFEISASGIRALAAEGADLRYLVPEPVRALINQHQCYATTEYTRPDGDRSTG